MADHKYVRKYMGKSGKMIYVYKDTAGHETILNPDEEGSDESGSLTSKKAQATISDADRRKEKFAAFYQKAVATGKEIVEASQEASQEEAKKKSGGSGSSKKASTKKQSEDTSASSSGDPTVEAFAQKIMSKSILYEDIPPQYKTKVKTFVESMKTTDAVPTSSSIVSTSSGGVSGGGAGRSGHADTTVKMSDVKADSPAITKTVDWVKKLFGK